MSSSSMQCPKCGNRRNIVYDSRAVQSDKAIRRRRKCESCSFKWITLEYPEQTILSMKKGEPDDKQPDH